MKALKLNELRWTGLKAAIVLKAKVLSPLFIIASTDL